MGNNIPKNYYCEICLKKYSLVSNCFYRYDPINKIFNQCNYNNKKIITLNSYTLKYVPNNKKPKIFIICKKCFDHLIYYRTFEYD